MACRKCTNDIKNKKGVEMCKCCEEMTQKQYDKFFGDQKKGCPYYTERKAG